MFVNVAVLKETQARERRVALSPAVAPDVALIIGANDVVNPAARSDKTSPIYGMPILNADQAKKAYVVKRGQGKGYRGVVNGLFYAPDSFMVYGDAAAVLGEMIEAVKGLGAAAA